MSWNSLGSTASRTVDSTARACPRATSGGTPSRGDTGDEHLQRHLPGKTPGRLLAAFQRWVQLDGQFVHEVPHLAAGDPFREDLERCLGGAGGEISIDAGAVSDPGQKLLHWPGRRRAPSRAEQRVEVVGELRDQGVEDVSRDGPGSAHETPHGQSPLNSVARVTTTSRVARSATAASTPASRATIERNRS
jgi:hypothetical protein